MEVVGKLLNGDVFYMLSDICCDFFKEDPIHFLTKFPGERKIILGTKRMKDPHEKTPAYKGSSQIMVNEF